jgi:NADH-quinone oxidoreductase subunit N
MSTSASLLAILPELALAVGMCLLLVWDLLVGKRRFWESGIFSLGILATVIILLLQRFETQPVTVFAMVRVDHFATLFQLVIAISAAAAIFLNVNNFRFPRDRGRMETQFLLMGAALGGFVLVGSRHMLMMYLGLELLSLCSYALADVHKRDRAGAEAAMKYVVYGALASGMLLFGISLFFGMGGFEMHDIAIAVSRALSEGREVQVLLPTLLVLVGFLFKLGAVPFHWWAPDVYQGTTTPIASFLAIGSKAVALAALLRFLASIFAGPISLSQGHPSAVAATGDPAAALVLDLRFLLGLVAALSMVFGNLAALRQNNLRRMLAYSSIGQAGYLLAGAAILSADGFQATILYSLIYALGTLGAFSALLYFFNRADSDQIQDLRGLGWSNPVVGTCLIIFLASLSGLPPTAGFIGKWRLMTALWAGDLVWLVVLMGLTTVVSLYYYFRIVRILFLDRAVMPNPERSRPRLAWLGAWLIALALATVYLLNISPLAELAERGNFDLHYW